MKRNVLITGGAGFIGTHLSRKLLEQGHSVTVLDNFSPQIHGDRQELTSDLASHVSMIRGDVRSLDAWQLALADHDVVVNLAAETGTGQSMYEVNQYEQVNLAGTANLYELLSKGKFTRVQRIVVASSRAVYGEGAYSCADHGTVYPVSRSSQDKENGFFDPGCPYCDGPIRSVSTPEDAPFQPSSFYGLTKQVQEQMTLMFGDVLGIPSIALRYQNVYGPGQSLKNPYTGILAIFSNLARTGAGINVFEDGQESRDFVYIDDVVNATSACIVSDLPGTHVVNVGSDQRTTVLQVAEAVNHFFGRKSHIQLTGVFRKGDIRHGLADLTRARHLIGFHPNVQFNDGLRRFLGWTLEFDPSTGSYDRSLTEMRERGLLYDGL